MERVEGNWSTYLFDTEGETVPLVEEMRLLYLRPLGNSHAFGKTLRKVVTYATKVMTSSK